jgi:hypothetical protein
MNNTTHNGMHMDGYSFMGMHLFWWVSIVLVALLILVITRRNKKRK